MNKSAGIWLGGAALLLLSACMQKDRDPAGPEGAAGEVGKAEIHLPALPPGFLLKAAQSRETAEPFFILTISGSGMLPRKHAWPLASAGGTAVTVENIPAGSRLFTGEIEAGGGIVYADSVWTSIEPGRTALVRLKLARTTGNAKVCVEIEGLPPPTGCGSRDSVPNVSGCWSIHGLDQDSANPLRIRILQHDSTLQAVINRPEEGRSDTARGFVTNTGYVFLDGDFIFSGEVETGTGNLYGKYIRMVGGQTPTRLVTLVRGSCDPVFPPVDSVLTCYDVAQYLDNKSSAGRFALLKQGLALYGHFQWKGYPGMPISGQAASVGGNTGLYLYGNLPTGLARDSLMSDGVHYKAQVVHGGTLEFGTIYGTNGAYVQRGDWKGSPSTCQPKDREVIRAVYGI